MIALETIIGVISIWTVAVVTPGPNFFITVRTASSVSRVSAFFVVLGICSGTLIWGISGYLGVSVLFMISPWLYFFIRVAGAVYLGWLGLTYLFKAVRPGETVDSQGEATTGALVNWQLGLLTNLSNPKTAIFVTSLFASALPPEAPMISGLIAVLLMVTISLTWYSLVMLMFSSTIVAGGYQKLQRWLDGLAGCVFISFGLQLIMEEN